MRPNRPDVFLDKYSKFCFLLFNDIVSARKSAVEPKLHFFSAGQNVKNCDCYKNKPFPDLPEVLIDVCDGHTDIDNAHEDCAQRAAVDCRNDEDLAAV